MQVGSFKMNLNSASALQKFQITETPGTPSTEGLWYKARPDIHSDENDEFLGGEAIVVLGNLGVFEFLSVLYSLWLKNFHQR